MPYKNKESEKIFQIEYQKNNQDKLREYRKQWRDSHKNYMKEYSKEYREINKDKLQNLSKEYRSLNKEEIKNRKIGDRDNINRRTRENRIKHPNVFKNRDLKKRFGKDFGIEKYNEMFKNQKGLCKICREPETIIQNGKIKFLSVDHSHSTGKIRGLLCNRCNRAIGLLKDDSQILHWAAEYLEKQKTQELP